MIHTEVEDLCEKERLQCSWLICKELWNNVLGAVWVMMILNYIHNSVKCVVCDCNAVLLIAYYMYCKSHSTPAKGYLQAMPSHLLAGENPYLVSKQFFESCFIFRFLTAKFTLVLGENPGQLSKSAKLVHTKFHLLTGRRDSWLELWLTQKIHAHQKLSTTSETSEIHIQ